MTDQVSFWLNSAGRYPLLDDEQLILLCKKRNSLKVNSKAYYETINKIALHNLRLVVNTAKSMGRKGRTYSLSGPNAADMLQHGFLGLRRAAEKYDIARGYKFSTYALPWIRQGIQRWASSTASIVYVPEGTIREVNYRRNNNGQPSGNTGAPMSEDVLISGHLALTVGSIDKCLGEESDGFILDLLGEHNSINYEWTGGRRCPSLEEIMNKAGIAPRVQELMQAYSKRGNMCVAAYKTKFSPKKAPKIIRETIAKLKEVA